MIWTNKCLTFFLPSPTRFLPGTVHYGKCTDGSPRINLSKRLPTNYAPSSGKARVAEYRQLKQRQLPFVTPHGVFSRRKSDALISASGLVVVDIDHLASLEEAEQLRDHLFEDPYLGTRLAFVSPGGLGVKLFIPGDETVRWAMSYIQLLYADTFKGEVDTCGKDIARCCFLSHDSNAKIFIP